MSEKYREIELLGGPKNGQIISITSELESTLYLPTLVNDFINGSADEKVIYSIQSTRNGEFVGVYDCGQTHLNLKAEILKAVEGLERYDPNVSLDETLEDGVNSNGEYLFRNHVLQAISNKGGINE